MANVIKDITEIWTRLFDHRPFLNGEIKLILQEFEEKRGDREVERLLEILQYLTEIRYTQIDKIKSEGEKNVKSSKAKIDQSYSVCNSILDKEGTYSTDTDLEANKQLRKAKLEALAEEIIQKCAKVDELFNEEEKNLRQYYSDLNNHLKSSLSGHSS